MRIRPLLLGLGIFAALLCTLTGCGELGSGAGLHVTVPAGHSGKLFIRQDDGAPERVK